MGSLSGTEDLAQLLRRANEGGKDALDALWTAVNGELRALARRLMEREFGRNLAGITLQPTALVDETFLRLIKQRTKYDSRGHFFAIATKVLMRVLRDYARERSAARRGGGWVRVPLDLDEQPDVSSPESGKDGAPIEELMEAVDQLQQMDPRKAEVVQLRLVWGLTIKDVAAALNVGHATVQRDWQFARAWLKKELQRVMS